MATPVVLSPPRLGTSCSGRRRSTSSGARSTRSSWFGSPFERIPMLRLVAEQPVEYQRDPFVFGMRRLPVAW
ncbi:hypothetical protein [Streptomyces sp. NPDC005091]